MKIGLVYGFIAALAGAFLTLALYFLGLHSDPAKLTAASSIGGVVGLAIAVTCVVLGVRARRSEVPVTEDFGYGRALGAGLLVGIVATVLSTLFNYFYNTVINPGFIDMLLQDRLSKMEASGMSGAQLDKAEAITRSMFTPVWQLIWGLVVGFIAYLIIALAVAAFVRREARVPPRV